jgi:fucose 4-O-acetylase-like acetyltransferase
MNRQYSALCGVAMLLVLINHAIHFGLQISPVAGIWLKMLIVLQALGTYAVPIFLFVSGAFVSYAAGALSFKFTKSSLERLIWPYLIWSFVFCVTEFLTRDVPWSITGWINNVLVGYPYHFVPLLIFCYIIAPLLVILGKRSGWLLLVIGLYQIFLLYLRFPSIFGGVVSMPGWANLLKPPVLFKPMADWAIYFPAGLIFSLHNTTWKPCLFRKRWVALAATVILFVLGILNAFGLSLAPWARFAAPIPLMFLLPIIDRGSIPQVRHFELLGKRSYGVYLTHFIVLNLMVFLANKLLPSLHGFSIIVFPTLLIAGLALSLLLTEAMAKRRSAQRVYRYVFG